MNDKYVVKKKNENGYPHYEIFDATKGKFLASCDLNELKVTIIELNHEAEEAV